MKYQQWDDKWRWKADQYYAILGEQHATWCARVDSTEDILASEASPILPSSDEPDDDEPDAALYQLHSGAWANDESDGRR